MSALYVMRYLGQTGSGFGVMYIGKGVVLGVDEENGRYTGTYNESGGRLKANVTLSAPQGGTTLVTGDVLPEGQSVALSADLSSSFADGYAETIMVMGQKVLVTFEKIGDIP